MLQYLVELVIFQKNCHKFSAYFGHYNMHSPKSISNSYALYMSISIMEIYM